MHSSTFQARKSVLVRYAVTAIPTISNLAVGHFRKTSGDTAELRRIVWVACGHRFPDSRFTSPFIALLRTQQLRDSVSGRGLEACEQSA
jgi:hypothetical protein